MPRIDREKDFGTYAVDVVGNLVTIPEMKIKAGVRLFIPAGTSLTTLTIYDAPCHSEDNRGVQYGSPAGTFLAAQDQAAGAAVTIAVAASKSYDVPAAVFASGAIKIVGNVAETIDWSTKG